MTQETLVRSLDGYTAPATIAAAGGLGLITFLLSGVGLAFLAAGALGLGL